MAWVILTVAGLLEIVWSLALKHAHGMTRVWPAVIGVGTAMLSLALLSVALKDLPIGVAYAVWVGIGTVGVTIAGMIVLGEQPTPVRLAFLTMIVIGIVGLSLAER
jgi:quaternary ammonium compound-resistance protein SugE